MDDDEVISYRALESGTPVVTSTGTAFGSVHHVLEVPELDVFDGISVKTKNGLRFVDRDQITEIRRTVVKSSLSDDDAANLPPPDGPPVYDVDVSHLGGHSLSDRLGRLFGRTPWRERNE